MIAAAPKVMPPSSTRTSAAPWCPPTEFDDYVLVRLVGRGAMGAVYLAEDRLLARQVAIKFVATVEPGEQARRHFENEARAVARVQHPNVISIYRAGVLDDRPYLVTEYVRGEPLDQLPSPMPWAKVLEIGIDLARGLAAAHRRGVLHCDIKPQNAILTDDGQAKLVDFGLARLTQGRAGEGRGEGGVPAGGGEGPGAKQQTPGEGLIRGTPHFMAPELWRREPPSKRSDVYGLGALLFYLAAGLCPFEGIVAHELWRHVQRVDAPPLRSLSPTVDARFAAIVDRCLRRAASDRFASGDDLRDALEQLKRRASIAPPPSGNPYRGLRAFEADHRALFRGRDVEIGVILDRLRSEQLVVVTGDSGVGKSSICRAGVLPAVCEGALGSGRMWTVFGVTPGERPLAAVAAAIAQFTGHEASWLEESARHHRGVLAEALAGRLGSDSGFLLFIDQAEELLTLSDPAERDAADAAVAALDALPGVRVLVSLRTDFLARFASLPNLGEDVARALYFLRPLSPDRVREVIVGPAEATGLRFESDEMVDELAAAAQAGGGLPLLQFALAELWEARDGHAGVIPRAALDALGGVGGALAKHADSVVLTLPPAQRAEARRMLVRLVTLDDTRARRSEAELGAKGPETRAALSALVRGRLLVAHEDEAGSAYELAHEVLIREWETLRRWLNEDVAKRGVRERLSAAATDWARAGRPKDVLWSARQLQEASALGPDDLGGLGGEFLRASGLARRRERRARLAALVGAPLVVALAYGGALAKSRYETGRRVGSLVGEAGSALVGARAARAEVAALRAEAFRRFDARERAGGEEAWAAARARAAAAGRGYERASNALEAAFAQDPGRADVRAMLGQTLYERALLAESANDADKAAELSQRFALYDPEGDLARRWNEPALVSLAGTPPGAHVVLEGGSGQARELGQAPLGPIELARGSYVFALSAPGRAAVRYPVLVGRGERLELSIDLPASSELPEGFIYVPPGRFLFGSADDEEVRRGFFDTTPRHEVRTGGYLVGRTEVTYGAWLEYLEALDPAERARRLPKAEAKIGQSGGLRLERRGEGWWLSITPSERTYEAHAGEKLLYVGRKERARQDWLKLPVTGISSEDFVAYAAWLDRTGRVPGARLCNEYEWERAARGADGRPFPHGDGLAGAEANYDETYGRDGKGPDEVGTYPASKSPFGLDDTSGNAFEWVRSSLDEGQFVVRGGSYLHDRKTSQLANRAVVTPSLRDTGVGGRLCVTFFRLPALPPTRTKGQAP